MLDEFAGCSDPSGARAVGWEKAALLLSSQYPVGMPVGFNQPIHQPSRMIRNSVTDNPTRSARARAMRRSGPSCVGLRLPSMKTPALASAPRMASKITMSSAFMDRHYSRSLAVVGGPR